MAGYRPLPSKSEDIAAQARRNREFWLASLDEAAATVDEFGEPAKPMLPEPDEDVRECPQCGSTETVELTTEGPPEQSINVCAGCGSDE